MTHEFVFAGFGGQGVMFVGQLLAYAAMDKGYNVTWIPSYGPEMRGGTANCFVTIRPHEPIGSPVVKHPEIGVMFNAPSFDKFEPIIRAGGLLAYNKSIIPQTSTRTDIDLLPVPATEMATQRNDPQLTNMIMLGAVLTARPILTIDDIKAALENHSPSHRRHKLTANFQALDLGVELVNYQKESKV